MSRVEAELPRVVLASARASERDEIAAAFEARGYDVAALGTSRAALSTLSAQPVHAMVIDANVPISGGTELAREVREHAEGADVALVLLTDGRWSASQKVAAIEAGELLDVVHRPIDPRHIVEIVDCELASRRPQPGEPLADPYSVDEREHVEQQARAARAGDIELRGNLQSTPFPELLHELYLLKADGALFLLRGNVKKIVYFHEGHPVFVKSNLLSECLGKVLVREGMIGEEDCQKSLERMRTTRRQQGTVLIEMGVISPQNLVVGLELQLRTKLFDLFAWEHGEFMFKADAALPSEVVQLDASNASLIAEGVQRWSEQRVREAIEPYLDCYVAPNPDPQLRFQVMPLDEVEQSLRDGADGRRTVAELCDDSPLPQPQAQAVAYSMIAAGILKVIDEPIEVAARADGEADDEGVRRRLAAELHSLSSRDAFGRLGVSPLSTDAEVEQAYSQLARRYHPDRFRAYAADTRRVAREIFGLFFAAYDRIATEQQRQAYREQLSAEDLEASAPGAGPVARAARVADDAGRALEEQRWHDAVETLERVVVEQSDAADLHAMLGWARFNTAPDDAEVTRAAIRELKRATQLSPREYRAYLYLGRVYAQTGKRILAEKQFEKALQCNPDSAEALEQLQIQKELRPKRRR